ncbi:MAG: hypothetical protein NDJ90_07005 [Oligoflexia bacterium]|nr:hypothetical protein [Oligoflexia bacterium]
MPLFSWLLIATLLGSAGLLTAEVGGWLHAEGPALAQLLRSEGRVRRLPHSRFAWDWIASGAPLRRGDAIATSTNSSASIHFEEGSELVLGESSLIILREKRHEIELSFVQGRGQLRSTEAGLPVPAKRRLIVKESPLAKVLRTEAPPQLETRPPAPFGMRLEARELPAAAASLHGNGELVATAGLPPAPEPRLPADGALADLNQLKNLTFTWQGPETRGASYELVLRPVGKTGGQRLEFRSSKPSVVVRAIPAGEYLWSIRTLSSQGQRSPGSVPRLISVRARDTLERPRLKRAVLEEQR